MVDSCGHAAYCPDRRHVKTLVHAGARLCLCAGAAKYLWLIPPRQTQTHPHMDFFSLVIAHTHTHLSWCYLAGERISRGQCFPRLTCPRLLCLPGRSNLTPHCSHSSYPTQCPLHPPSLQPACAPHRGAHPHTMAGSLHLLHPTQAPISSHIQPVIRSATVSPSATRCPSSGTTTSR